MLKQETPTAATMRLDGGHPVLDLVNTVYGQVGRPVEHDVLAAPADLVTFARRVALAGEATAGSGAALAAARALRDALDALLRASLADRPLPPRARTHVEAAVRTALAAARLTPRAPALAWTWPVRHAFTPVHRLALSAAGLLTDSDAMARLQCCDGCRWLYIDHSRGPGRRWCSMADCGTNAKKRRYVEARRRRRTADLPRA